LEFWEDFLQMIPETLFFDFIAEKLSGAFKPPKKRRIYRLIKGFFKENNPSCVMEICTAEGGSLFCFCKLARNNAKIQLIYHF